MQKTTLHIDKQTYTLESTTDLDVLKEAILHAARTSAFVDFDTSSHGHVSILMTAHTPVRLESRELDEHADDIDQWVETWPQFDPESYAFAH